jgi:hypothetical protein
MSTNNKTKEYIPEFLYSPEAIHATLASAGFGTWEVKLDNNTVSWDDRCKALFGLAEDNNLSYAEAIKYIHPDDLNDVTAAVARALKGENNGKYKKLYRTVGADDGKLRWVDFTGQAYFDDNGKAIRFAGIARDVSESKKYEAINYIHKESEERLRSIIDQAPMAVGVLKGKNLIVEMGNDKIFEVWGKLKVPSINKPLIEVLPEIKGQGFIELLEGVYDSGNAFQGNAVLARLLRGGKLEDVYFDFTYAPLRDEDGLVNSILILAMDVTEKVLATKKLEESEREFRQLADSLPELVWTTDPTGKQTFASKQWQAFSGLEPNDQDTFQKIVHQDDMDSVIKVWSECLATGSSYRTSARLKHKSGEYQWFLIHGEPIKDKSGKIEKWIGAFINVHEQKVAEERLIEVQKLLESAIDLAQLAIWRMDVRSGNFTYSPRFMEWLGLTEETITREEAYVPVPDGHRQQVIDRINSAVNGNASGVYENEHPIVNQLTGEVRIIHAHAQVIYGKDNEPVELRGTAQDVTIHRNLQQALEREVQIRTEEVAATNEELQVTNEELIATNNELEEKNQTLIHTNEELEQYAYVASHDLQEPLRKILTFSDRLAKLNDLQPEGANWVSKISSSAARMSLLIRDLLDFSRLLKSEDLIKAVDLNSIVSNVKDDFEIVIEETKAQIEIGKLPVIEGIGLQLNQLFYNLLSNSLKFINPGISPVISISSRPVGLEEVSQYISSPNSMMNYHQITFSDNGIGFESEYSEHVFEIFKRLHTRGAYQGSGIGLALCKRIVTNHKGYIYAKSELGKGTKFNIILPTKLR